MPLIPSDKELQKLLKRKPRRGKPVKVNRQQEVRLRRAVSGLWKDVLLPATERIKELVRQGTSASVIAQAIEDALLQAQLHYGRQVNGIIDRWVAGVDREVQNALHRTMYDALGVDVAGMLAQPDVKDMLDLAGTQAAMLIKTIPQQYLGKVAEAVADNFAGRDLPEGRSLLQQIQHIGGVSYRRAKVIARDQTSKLTASLNEHRQSAVGIEEYVWRTVKDERVVGRPGGVSPVGNPKHMDHYHREGKTFRWDNPPSDGHPGYPIQCRCWAEPVIDPKKIIKRI